MDTVEVLVDTGVVIVDTAEAIVDTGADNKSVSATSCSENSSVCWQISFNLPFLTASVLTALFLTSYQMTLPSQQLLEIKQKKMNFILLALEFLILLPYTVKFGLKLSMRCV